MGGRFIIEAWAELAVAILVIILRLYAKFTRRGWKGMTIDDGLIIVAGIFYALETTAAHFVVEIYLGMANNNVLPELRATLDSNSQEWRHSVNGSKTHVVGWFTYICLFWTLKCCWTLLYRSLTKGVPKLDRYVKFAWFLNAVTFVAAICMVFLKCWPLHRQWQINPDPGNNCYPGASKLQVSFVMGINTITEIYLMFIAFKVVVPLKRSLREKISLTILFSGGGTVMIFGILRCSTLVSVLPTQPSQSGQWSVRESFLALVISNGPMIYPLFKTWFSVLDRKISRHGKTGKSATYPLDSREGTSDSGQERKSSDSCFFRPLDPNYDSQEAIVRANQDENHPTNFNAVCVANKGGDVESQGPWTDGKNIQGPEIDCIKITHEWKITREEVKGGHTAGEVPEAFELAPIRGKERCMDEPRKSYH